MKKTRILFVEDDLDYRYLIERELEKEKDFELGSPVRTEKPPLQAGSAPPAGYRFCGLSLGIPL